MLEKIVRFDAEQSVLGSLLIENESLDKIGFLSESDFYAPAHKKVFNKIKEIAEIGKPFDMVTISESFNSDELDMIGGFAYIVDLVKNTPTSRNVVSYADIVLDMSNRRKAIEAMEKAKIRLTDIGADTVDVINDLEGILDKTIISSSQSDVLSVDELIDMSLNEMDFSMANARTGLSSGIREVDERLGYKLLAFGEITAIGGLSKNGKTLLANTILARAKYEDNETAHVFSIEMPTVGMFNGIVSAMSGVPSNFYARQDFYMRVYGSEYEIVMAKWGKAAQELKNSNRITIDGQKQVDADYICANMEKQFAIHRNNGKRLRLVVIDHIHRMDYKTNGQPLTYAIREAIRKIKNTAAKLDVAVIAICQLNNSAENKDPTSFHILDSSSIRHEMQAFIGSRIYRQDGLTYFGIFGDSPRYGDMDTKITPDYMKLQGGVLRSLSEGEFFTPKKDDE